MTEPLTTANPYSPPEWRKGTPPGVIFGTKQPADYSTAIGCGCISGVVLVLAAVGFGVTLLGWVGGVLIFIALLLAPLGTRGARRRREAEKLRASWKLPASPYLELDRAACADAMRWLRATGRPELDPERIIVEQTLIKMHLAVLEADELIGVAATEERTMGQGFSGPAKQRLKALDAQLRQDAFRLRQLADAVGAAQEAEARKREQEQTSDLQARLDANAFLIPLLVDVYAQALSRLEAENAAAGLPAVSGDRVLGKPQGVDPWVMPDDPCNILSNLKLEIGKVPSKDRPDSQAIDNLQNLDVCLSAALARLQTIDLDLANSLTNEARSVFERIL